MWFYTSIVALIVTAFSAGTAVMVGDTGFTVLFAVLTALNAYNVCNNCEPKR